MNFVFQQAFYCHVYHHSLHFIPFKATMAKEKEYLRYYYWFFSKLAMSIAIFLYGSSSWV